MVPGEIKFGDGDIVLNEDRTVVTLHVKNAGDRPIQVGSHYHFAEVNPCLEIRRRLGEPVSRDAARGLRLHIAAGTSVRFETDCDDYFAFVPLAGNRVVPGLRGETAGPVDGNGIWGQDDE
ncbi:urease subunit beta [Streptomyces sp. RPA4-5]|uniref:urease subunit beta n=1 Tax=unclassified Streptomyces TaxID=2593676 RepID=UPI00143EA530|nr:MULTISPECIES: urease subunit beta [unclassified Streptomyces]QIY58356.1 urease subunit beta [Streptomyces sp. RPA4-5]WJY41574.1 urease subunit beta [Streptomyces sp. P9-2B-2]